MLLVNPDKLLIKTKTHHKNETTIPKLNLNASVII